MTITQSRRTGRPMSPRPKRRGIGGAPVGPCRADYGIERCTIAYPCVSCLNVRSRAIELVGRDFPARGVAVQQAITENA